MGERAGKGDQLLLTGGEGRTALPDFFFEAVGERADEVSEVDIFGRLFHILVSDPGRP